MKTINLQKSDDRIKIRIGHVANVNTNVIDKNFLKILLSWINVKIEHQQLELCIYNNFVASSSCELDVLSYKYNGQCLNMVITVKNINGVDNMIMLSLFNVVNVKIGRSNESGLRYLRVVIDLCKETDNNNLIFESNDIVITL